MEGFGYAALLVTSSALDSGIGIESLRTLIARVGKAIFEHSDLEDFFEKKKNNPYSDIGTPLRGHSRVQRPKLPSVQKMNMS